MQIKLAYIRSREYLDRRPREYRGRHRPSTYKRARWAVAGLFRGAVDGLKPITKRVLRVASWANL